MKPRKISYADILSVAGSSASRPANDYEHWTAGSEDWGSYEEKVIRHNHVGIREITAYFESDCQVSVTDETLPDSVHICIPLSGYLSASYHTCQLYTDMLPGRHHHCYVPATEYEWMMSGSVRFVDIKLERDYFTGLLSDAEPWSAQLREKLLRKEMTQSRQGMLCPGIQNIMQDILYTPLGGYLKRIFIEAKVLELIALQLHHSRSESAPATGTLKKKDREIFAAIHEYLTVHFREEQSLQRLSKMFGLNEFILKKGFKSLYGKTIFDYLFELKMNHARHLLLEEGKMVCEVSREVGYRNPNHFSTAFKKQFGFNPVLLRQ